jgi:hypothetical protein
MMCSDTKTFNCATTIASKTSYLKGPLKLCHLKLVTDNQLKIPISSLPLLSVTMCLLCLQYGSKSDIVITNRKMISGVRWYKI